MCRCVYVQSTWHAYRRTCTYLHLQSILSAITNLFLQPLSIEISDSNKRDMPLRYKICAEVLVPGINSSDLSSIFDEHRICKQLGVLGEHQFHEVKR